jgi:hypothetical protein
MPELPDSIPPSLDQSPYSEHLRRQLYEAVVRTVFAPSPEKDQLLADLGVASEEEVPTYSPDDAGLAVFYVWGRWFAVWYDLDTQDEAHLPISRRWQVVRVQDDASRPDGIVLSEV